MRTKSMLISALLFHCCTLAETGPRPQLYLAMGQSNMVGLGAFAENAESHPRIQYRIRNLYLPAGKDPEWSAVPVLAKKDGKLRGLGPWWAFSHATAEALGKVMATQMLRLQHDLLH